MLEQFFKSPAPADRLRGGPLGSQLELFAENLLSLGYAPATIRWQLWLLADLGRWLQIGGRRVVDLSEAVIREFLEDRGRRGCLHGGNASAALKFLDHLRSVGTVPASLSDAEPSPRQRIEQSYEKHLREVRGLAVATITGYLPIARQFVGERFRGEDIDLRELCASDVTGFVLRHAHAGSPGRAKLMVTVLRSFLRFLLQSGEVPDDLAAIVPTVADWRLSSVPQYLKPAEIERLLDACDQTRKVGQRDHAILMLLARLGLRAGEIVAMELDDIDWRNGEIMVRGKGSQLDRLPLPPEVGEDLARYLSEARPLCRTRRVFVRMKAPLVGFSSPAAVSTLVRRAIDRAGLAPAKKGAHLLRHSLATRMLGEGASMAEIGDLLRHRAASSTEIYAKVDIASLRSLAQPWPGSGGGR